MKQLHSIRFLAVLGAGLICTVATRAEDNWPQFRGPRGDGTTESKGLPVSFGETNKVKWKTPIHGRAWSSPVVWGDQVWMTSATPDGRELYGVCVDKNTGKIIFDKKLYDVASPQFAHAFNTHASPTPVIEEGRVYLSFGAPGTICLDTKTFQMIWERTDFVCNHFRGPGASPIIYQNLILLHFDGSDFQYSVAMNKDTGKTVWKVDRSIDYKDIEANGKPKGDGDYRKAFATPQIGKYDGKDVMLSLGSKAAYGYNPLNGDEYFRVEDRTGYSASTRPLVYKDTFIYGSGSGKPVATAVSLGKIGLPSKVVNIDDPNRDTNGVEGLKVVWRMPRSVPTRSSLQLLDGLIYMVDDNGVGTCLDAATGEIVWNQRVGGNYSASPILSEGRIYFFSETGKITVIEAGRTFKMLAENQLGAPEDEPKGIMASPAVTGKALIIRTRTHLYRIEE